MKIKCPQIGNKFTLEILKPFGGTPTVDGQNPAPPSMMIIPLFIGF